MDENRDVPGIFKEKMSRRTFIKRTAAGAAGTAVLLSPGMKLLAKKKDALEFVVWNYSLETIQDNIKKFEAGHPGITVNLTDYTWPTYHDTLVLRFKGKTRTDIIYNGEDWLPEWAAAGWVAPLEDYFPEIRKYLIWSSLDIIFIDGLSLILIRSFT